MFEISLPWLHLFSYNACPRYLKSRQDLRAVRWWPVCKRLIFTHHCTSSNLRSKDYLGGKRSEELFFQVRGHIPFSFHFHGFRVTFVVITQAVISTHVDESTVAVVARTTGFIHVGSRSWQKMKRKKRPSCKESIFETTRDWGVVSLVTLSLKWLIIINKPSPVSTDR